MSLCRGAAAVSQFIDLSILLGCDYCDKIKGIGPSTALKLIKEHHTIEAIIEKGLNEKQKAAVPIDWPYKQARGLFVKPDVTLENLNMKWGQPDVDGLIEFMCVKNGFAEKNIRNAIDKLKKGNSGPVQNRMTSFFKVLPGKAKPAKRKVDEKKGKKGSKKAKR